MTVARPISRPAVASPAVVDLWMDDAECVGNWELFFPDHADPSPAKQICRGCPVRRQCLAYALRAGEWYGIWGGMTPGERRSHVRLRLRRPPDAEPGTDAGRRADVSTATDAGGGTDPENGANMVASQHTGRINHGGESST